MIATGAIATADEIAALFLAHDVIPAQCTYLCPSRRAVNGKCHACAVGILLVDALGGSDAVYDRISPVDHPRDLLERATGWPAEFIAGLDEGFTQQNPGEVPTDFFAIQDHPLYREGFLTGWRAAEIVWACR